MRRKAKAQEDLDVNLVDSLTSRTFQSSPSCLPLIERCLYWCSYIGLIVYATYRVYVAGNEYEEYLPAYSFNPGWSFIGRQQDVSNFEYSFWFEWFTKIYPWLLGHIVFSRMSCLLAPQLRRYISPIFCIVALTYLMGWRAVVLLIAHCVIAYLVAVLIKSTLCVWATCLLLLSTLNFNPFSDLMRKLFDDDPYENYFYLLIFSMALLNIRYISFCLEVCREAEPGDDGAPSNGIIDMFTYCFYLPLFFCGPIFTYDTFQSQISRPVKPWNKKRVVECMKMTVRIVIWWIFYETMSHFLYTEALLQSTHFMQTCSKWVLSGIAYLSGQFFMVKYVLLFGLPSLVASVDDLDPPQGPICISRIYLYSQMWKCFDRGLYSFLKRHIYIPLGGSSYGIVRQVFASFACFVFIFYWHGAEHYLFVWVLLNFIGIILETARKCLSKLPALQSYQFPFSGNMERRFTAFVSVPLLGLSTFGYFFFMGGSEVGEIYIRRLLDGSSTTLALALAYYVQIQVSMDIDTWERS